jgi:hypothetical protein
MSLAPSASAKLRNLAISESGFVFSPTTGNTFLLNETGIFILRKLMAGDGREKILESLLQDYTVTREQAERDLADLLLQLKELSLLD